MKIRNLIYVALLAFASCSKEALEIDSNLNTETTKGKTVKMIAKIGSDAETKVVVDGSKTQWEIGDVIYIGREANYYKETSGFPSKVIDSCIVSTENLSEDKKTVEFDIEIEEYGVYSAAYKYNYPSSNIYADTEYTQKSVGNFDYVGDNIWMPTGEFYIFEDTEDCMINFKHRSTIFDMNFELSSDITGDYSVKSVTLEMPTEILFFTYNGGSVRVEGPEYFKLNMSEGTILSQGKGFRAVLPAVVRSEQDFEDGEVLKIHITYSDGSYSVIEKSPKVYKDGVRYSANIIIDEVVSSSPSILLENTRAGELNTIFPSNDNEMSVSDIKVTGPVDGTDMKELIDKYPYAKNLDLSEAVFYDNIIPMSAFYYEKFPSSGFNIVGGSAYSPETGYSRASYETIILPTGLKGIYGCAFLGLPKLKEIAIPESVDTLGSSVLSCCPNLKKLTLPSDLRTIPEEMVAFSGLEEFVVPESVESIGRAAFYDCPSLNTVKLNSKVNNLGTYMFSYSSIKSIIIPASVETIQGAFYNCSELESVTFEANSNIKTLVNYYFVNGFSGTITNSAGAFENCTLLKSIKLPEGLETIGTETFTNTGITTIDIPSSVTTCENAFANSTTLENVNFSANSKLESIAGSFQGCKAIKSVEIPKSVTNFGSNTFIDCILLESVTFEEGSVIKEMCGSNSSSNYYSPFMNTPNLKSIVLPNSITTVGIGLFAQSTIETITLGDKVEKIDFGAFTNCKNLSLIKCYTQVPPVFAEEYWREMDSFKGAYSNMQLQVKDKSLDAYKADSKWNWSFNLGKNIIGGLK